MASITDICNAAISHCGTRSKISSIDEGSVEANSCATHLPFVRDSTLRAGDWNFARRTMELATLLDPPERWSYKYGVPTDCIRVRRLNDVPVLVLPETFFEMAADVDQTGAIISVILTNISPLAAIYTAQVTDPLRWDAGFTDAIIYGLAARVCYELTGKEDRTQMLTKMWAAALDTAKVEMANEQSQPNRTYVPENLAARGYNDGLAEYGQVWPGNGWPWPQGIP